MRAGAVNCSPNSAALVEADGPYTVYGTQGVAARVGTPSEGEPGGQADRVQSGVHARKRHSKRLPAFTDRFRGGDIRL